MPPRIVGNTGLYNKEPGLKANHPGYPGASRINLGTAGLFGLVTKDPSVKTSKAIRILVVDDHFMVRMGLSASLNVEADMQVVAEAANADQALDTCTECNPTVALVDVRLPGMDGIDASAELLRRYPAMRILILSTQSNEEDVYRAVQAGAHGYILKGALREELLHAIREVHAGRKYFDRSAAQLLEDRMSRPQLTRREIDVLKMLAKGMSNKDIASRLFIAEVTVKMHVTHLFEKLEVSDRTEAAAVAIQRGIIVLD
jgi:DNA-binding NarL/FixJ family response regulator